MPFQKMSNLTIVLFIILTLSFDFPLLAFGAPGEFKTGSEPDGFRGIKWGTEIATLKDMEEKKTIYDKSTGLYIKKYKRKNDILKLSGTNLELPLTEIRYTFFNNKLASVELEVDGIDNALVLKYICFETFGEGKEDNSLKSISTDLYTWIGLKTTLYCMISNREKKGVVEMDSNEILNYRRHLIIKEKMRKFEPKSKDKLGF